MAAALALVAGCKDQDPGSRTAPAGSATRTTGGSSDLAAPRRADNGLDQAKTTTPDRIGSSSATADSAAAGSTNAGSASGDSANKDAAGAQKSVSGTLAQASADEVRVDSANQPGLRLKVNSSTKVTLDGKEASVTQLQEGAQIRASYSLAGDQPTALRIEAKSATK